MAVIAKEKDTVTTKRNDVRNNSQRNFSTRGTRSTAVNDNKARGISMERCFVTPEMAQEMLNTMEVNRTLKAIREAKYTDDILNDRWKESPQPIVFDTEGRLIDGQHRLQSVIKANIPAIFWVATNVPPDTPIDKGLPRSSGDSLRCRGLISEEMARNSSMALINAVFRLKGQTLARVSDDDRAILANNYEKEILLAISIAGSGSSVAMMRKAGCTAAVFMAMLSGVDIDRLYDFAECVNTGEITHVQRGALKLRDFLQATDRPNSNEVASITEQAICDFMQNHPRKQAYKSGNYPYSSNIKLEDLLQ